MSKISPGADLNADASQQPAQQMVQAARGQKGPEADPVAGSAVGTPRMSFAAQKIVHTPETSADYEKRLSHDKELKGLHVPEE